MALTKEQKDVLRKDPRFMSVIKKREVATDGVDLSVKERVEKRRQNRISKQETTIVDTPEGTAVEEKVDGTSKIGGFIKGAGKGLLSTARGTLGLAQKAFEAPTRALGIKTEEKTAAEQLIPEEAVTPEGTAEKIGFGVEQVAEFFAPIPGARVAKGVAAGTKLASKAPKLAKAGLEAAEVAGRTAAQTGELGAGEVAAGVSAPIVGGVISKAGAALFKQLPKRFIRSALNQSKRELKGGKDVSEFVLEKKKVGSIDSLFKGSQEEMKKLNSVIDSKISSLKVTGDRITRKGLIDELEKTAQAAEAKLDTEDLLNMIETAVPRSKTFLDSKQLSVKNANELRKRIDKKLGDAFFLQSAEGSQSKEVLGELRTILSKRIKELSGTTDEFAELSSEITLSKALEDLQLKDRNQILSFGDLIGAGLGTAVGGPAGTVGGIAARRAVQSTPFLTGAGVSLDQMQKAAPILQKLEPAERGILSQIFQKIFDTIGQEK